MKKVKVNLLKILSHGHLLLIAEVESKGGGLGVLSLVNMHIRPESLAAASHCLVHNENMKASTFQLCNLRTCAPNFILF